MAIVTNYRVNGGSNGSSGTFSNADLGDIFMPLGGGGGGSGTSGTSGTSGDDGTSGTSGANGANGNNGTNGTSGTSAGSTPTFTTVTIVGYGSVISEGWGFRFASQDGQHPAQFGNSIYVGSLSASGSDYGSGNGLFEGTITENYSDRRLKTNIQVIQNALNKIKTINGVTFNPDVEKLKQLGVNRDGSEQVGFLADEVQSVLPQAVFIAPFDMGTSGTSGKSKSGEDYLTVKYELTVPLLLQAIKELSDQVDSLKARIQILENK